MKLFITIFLFLNISVFSQRPNSGGDKQQTQGTASVKGLVIDKKTNQAVEYSTIALLRARDSGVVTGVVTNEKGQFSISALRPGKYMLRVQFIGYKTFLSEPFELVDVYDARTIAIEETSSTLAEVTVNGQRPEIETRIDKKIISVDPTLASSGTAIDVLQRVPSVSVDQDGNVSMRGNSNVTILMDGRQSGYTSLEQIPASIIDRVEVVTNPSARYDASGIGGIINIITKKNTRRGMNGMIQLNAGTQNRYNGTFSLNYGVKKWNFFLSADGRAMQNRTSTQTEYLWKSGVRTFQESNDFRKGRMGGVKMGIDFRPDDSNTFSLTSNFRGGAFNSNGSGNLFVDSTLNGGQSNKAISTATDNSMQSFSGGLEYKHIFPKKEHELVVSTGGGVDAPLSSSLVSKSNILSKAGELRFDYTRPLAEKTSFSTGAKYMNSAASTSNTIIVRGRDSSYSTTQSFITAAGYAIVSQTISKVKLQAGMRVENTAQQYVQNNDLPWNKSYLDWFPSGGIGLELSENKSVQLNYSRRINRPSSPQLLTPSINYSDTMNLSKGNPQLKSEYINSLELTYTYSKQPFSLTTTAFYRQTTGTIVKTVSLLDAGKTMSTYTNGGAFSSFGVEQVVLMPLSKKLRMNLNFSLFGVDVRDSIISSRFGSPFFTGMMKLNLSFTPFKSFDISSNIRYNAPTLNMQGNSGGRAMQASGASGLEASTWPVDLSVKKEFFQGLLAINVRVQDLFNGENRFYLHSYSSEFESSVTRTRISRSISFGLTYKLNEGMKQNKKRQQQDQQDDF